jgi:hypothetical protein
MKKITLMAWSDSNFAGNEWTWLISLTVRKDGTYSVGAMQTDSEGLAYRVPAIYPLRNVQQVKAAIEQLFLDDSLYGVDIDWQGIITILEEHVPELAQELAQSFI